MLTVIFKYFIDYAFVFGVKTFQECLMFLFSLNERFGLVMQIYVLNIEFIKLIQIVV